jgi:hypothetical protein
MIVAISYYDGDVDQMLRWSSHVAKLGSYKNHKIVIAPAHGATTEGIKENLQSCFGEVIEERCHHSQKGWPVSCNLAFEQIAWLAFNNLKAPFLWMEPDAVPLKASWIDDIESAYLSCGKPFMGDFVKIAGVMPNGVDHMSGIAVYHWNMPSLAPSIFNNIQLAWDIASSRHVVHQMARTSLIQHDWIPDKKWRRDEVTPDCVKDDAVIYHPDKKGILFNNSLSPNGTQGDPAAGVPCEGNPHETKETKLTQGTEESEEQAIKESINVLAFYSTLDAKTKKKIIQWLGEKGLVAKTKSSVKPRKKVRSSVGKRGRPRAGGGVQIPPDSEVAV